MLEKKNADLVARKEELSRDLADADRRAEKLEKEIGSLKRNPNAVATNHSSPAAETAELVVKGEEVNGTMLVSGLVWLIWCECVTYVFISHSRPNCLACRWNHRHNLLRKKALLQCHQSPHRAMPKSSVLT